MVLYSYVEERYCTKCKKNVAIERNQNEDGSQTLLCLHKSCNDDEVAKSCFAEGQYH